MKNVSPTSTVLVSVTVVAPNDPAGARPPVPPPIPPPLPSAVATSICSVMLDRLAFGQPENTAEGEAREGANARTTRQVYAGGAPAGAVPGVEAVVLTVAPTLRNGSPEVGQPRMASICARV